MIVYQNYHRHTQHTNPLVPDSVATNEQYALRAKELGHSILSSCEHGYQGRYIECYNLAKKYGLKFVQVAEAYWVKRRDPALADGTNCHIIIAALNEAGRKQMNKILSEANRSGFYRRARLDLKLLLSFDPDNVIITSACIAGWRYDDAEEIMLTLFEHFGNHFYLEVQAHNTESQRELNSRIKKMHNTYKIPLIYGCDSHYIYEEDTQERTDFLYSKEIEYPDEEGWYLDYPDGDTVYKRFVEQGVLSHDEIMEALGNTNVFLQVEDYHSDIFNQEIKLPTLYPNLTQEQKDKKYQSLVWKCWEDYKKQVPIYLYPTYEKEIKREIDIVIESHMADYFILNYYIIKRGKELGGVITSTGRGSAVSFITNRLLGFTEVDRITAHVEMYPERFMSATRILETGSLPDIDFNLGTIEPFAQAQKEILGDDHAYPMIALGTMKTSASWKLFAKACDIPFETANAVSEQLKKYDRALKHSDDDEKDNISIHDFVDNHYINLVKESEKYNKTVVSWSIAPSAYLLYQGSIEEEIGLVRIKDKMCCLMDGHWAEDNRFLKNDLLKVVVVDLIDQVFKEIGKPRLSVDELLQTCVPTDKAWNVYATACTMGVNQVEQSGTAGRVAKFKPTNIAELCAFVAAIRPGFKSMYKKFESREPFSYNIPSFDKLIQTKWMPNSFVLYQEHIMRTLNYAGIVMSECYAAIKNISKKRVEKVLVLKEQFTRGFSQVLTEKESMLPDTARRVADKVWQIVEDNSGYGFNASHAYCVALDSLYCAYLKSHYPTEFYGVYIRLMTDAGKKEKVQAAQREAESYYRIKFPPFRFGQDNSQIAIDAENKSIYKPLSSIKGFNKQAGLVLAAVRDNQYNYLSDLLIELRPHKITPTVTKLLCKIDYFEQFGNQREVTSIINMVEYFDYGRKNSVRESVITGTYWEASIKKHSTNIGKKGNILKTYTIQDCLAVIHDAEDVIKNAHLTDVDLKVKIQNQNDVLGYISTQTNKEEDRRLLIVLDVRKLISKTDNRPWGYAIETQSVGSGKHGRMTIKANDYNEQPISKSDIIYADNVYKNRSGYWYLNQYTKKG